MTVLEAINAFVEKKSNYADFSKSMVENLLIKENGYSLLSSMSDSRDAINKEYLDEDIYKESVKQSVQRYSKDKDNAISIYLRLTNYLDRIFNTKIKLDRPPIKVSNTLERQIYIIKRLQDPEVNVEKLMDELWMGRDTIEDDIRAICGSSGTGINIGGRKLYIDGAKRSRGMVSFKSTAHPLIMVNNLSEVIVMLKGLQKISEDTKYEDIAISLASEIWSQLSPYAHDRIKTVIGSLMNEDTSWFSLIEKPLINKKDNAFITEETLANMIKNYLLISLKSELPCTIRYASEDGPVVYENVVVKRYITENNIEYIKINTGEILETERVISCDN